MYKNIISLKILLIIILFFLNGCASSPDTSGKQENDPFESINREIYAFNDGADGRHTPVLNNFSVTEKSFA